MEVPRYANGARACEFDLVELTGSHAAFEPGSRGTVVIVGGGGALVVFPSGERDATSESERPVEIPYDRLRRVRQGAFADSYAERC